MANKRIKISELPKITYNQTGDSSITNNDYVPITVTNKTDLTVKTTMAVTTRELQRFVLQQDESLDNETNTLTLGRPGNFTVKASKLTVSDVLTVDGSCVFNGDVQMASITLTTGNFSDSITVGQSVYPSILKNSTGNLVPYGLLVADSTGRFRGTGTSLQSLVYQSPVTTPLNSGRVVTINNEGKLSFSFKVDELLSSEGSITTSPSNYGNILAVGNLGGMNANTGINLTTLNNTVTAVSATFTPTNTVDSVQHKFLTTSNSSPSVDDINYHNSDLTVKKVNDAVAQVDGPFQAAGTFPGTQKMLVSIATSPGVKDIQVASDQHMKLVKNITSAGDAKDWIDSNSSEGANRTVVTSPLVLAGKHMDDVDLTDNTTNYQLQNKIGPRDFAANIGEIRWNVYNGVPTIYLAVSKITGSVSRAQGACYWYGIPLFGTIDLDTTYNPTTGYLDDSARNKHSYDKL